MWGVVWDTVQGNRVLDVYSPASIFLLGHDYERAEIYYDLQEHFVESGLPGIDLRDTPILSFKFRAPLAIELWDIFNCEVVCLTEKGHPVTIRIRPLQPASSPCPDCDYCSTITKFEDNVSHPSMNIHVDIGRNFLDGTWHVIWLNLPEIVQCALERYVGLSVVEKANWQVVRAGRVIISGRMFRFDDLVFRKRDYSRYSRRISVDVFESGHLYAQLFEPYRYLLMADYEADDPISNVNKFLMDPNNFIYDPNRIRSVWISDLLALDPNYHPINPESPFYDPDYTDRWLPGDPNFGTPDPIAENYLRKGFYIDITLPLFSDPNLRMGGSRSVDLRRHGHLGWNVTLNDFGSKGVQAFLVQPLPVDPYDGMPTYMVNRYSALEAIDLFGKAHFDPKQSFTLESAMWNVGVLLWPHYTPYYFENLVVALQIANQNKIEKLTFTITTVNYPVENYSPQPQARIFPRFFKVGQESQCTIVYIDPDCLIFSMAQFYGRSPATTHLPMLPGNKIRTDQDKLVFHIHIEDLPYYKYGPWIDSDMDHFSGICRLTPKFEGLLHFINSCTDPFGATSISTRDIYCINPGTWYNHSPIVTSFPTPKKIKAGEEIILNARAIDPDGDYVYASCNIGSIGMVASGDSIWTFQTNFPGLYILEIIFFDMRGGYTSRDASIQVVPWWSY
jgi:hypothetical protein